MTDKPQANSSINTLLFEQLQAVVNECKEPITLIEQPSAYSDEVLRLVYIPEDQCFLVGPNAAVDYENDGNTIYPSYLRNVAEVSRGIFESEEVWLHYVTNLWTAHSLNAHFVTDLDASYSLFSSVQAIIRSEEDKIEVSQLSDGSKIYYYPEEKMIRHVVVAEDNTENNIDEESIYDESEDVMLVKFVAFWEQRNEKIIQSQLARAQEGILNGDVTEEDTEELEEEFDLDNLYDGVPSNSENPIDTSKPEEVEDTGCAGGACTL